MTDINLYLESAVRITGTVEIEAIPGSGETGRYVLQRTAKGAGNLPQNTRHDMQLRRRVIPHDPRTPAQLANRVRIAAATSAWRQMSDEQRGEFRERAKKLYMTGFNLHIREFTRSHPIEDYIGLEPGGEDYTPPAGNALHFDWTGTAAYTAPAGNTLHFNW